MKIIQTERAAWLIVGAVFAALCALKFALIFPETFGPTILNDERVYVKYARQISARGNYVGINYPLLYPSLIAICLQFGDNFYAAIKTMNVVLSSLVVFPAYMLSRLMLPRLESLLIVAIVAALPYHLVMPRLIMSENIYFPLFLFTLYLCLRPANKAVLAWDVLLGVCIGALFLTRYLTVPLLPAFALCWLITNWERAARPWVRGVLIAIVFLATVSPWFVMGFASGFSLKSLIGFKIASKAIPEQKTLTRLAIWTWLYLSYFALLAAPFLLVIVATAKETVRSFFKPGGLYKSRIHVAVGLITLFFAIAVIRHSWNAQYNYPDFQRIMGRYLIYLPPLFAISAIAAVRTGLQVPPVGVITAFLLSTAVVVAAYATLISGAVFPLGPRFLTDRGSVDAFAISVLGFFWLAIMAGGLVCLAALLVKAPLRAPVVMCLVSVGASLAAIPPYQWHLSVYLPQTVATYELLRRRVKDDFVIHTQHLPTIESRKADPAVALLIDFFKLKGETSTSAPAPTSQKRHFVVGRVADLEKYSVIEELRRLRSRDEDFILVEIDPSP